jgi:hypothetical protein
VVVVEHGYYSVKKLAAFLLLFGYISLPIFISIDRNKHLAIQKKTSIVLRAAMH